MPTGGSDGFAPELAGAGLRALYLNCTLKRSPAPSHTQALIDASMAILRHAGAQAESVRVVDLEIATGMGQDMSESGEARDDWPALFDEVRAADILVLATPIWLGEKSSVCTRIVERLYAMSSLENDEGQYVYYGRAAGCLVTGNEDGYKHCAMNLTYSLQHIGFTVPPQADAAWVGPAGPGPSYLDPDSGGPENDFTNRSVTFMSWNLIHVARMLKRAGGLPAHGNVPSAWQEGERFGHPGPEAVRRARNEPDG